MQNRFMEARKKRSLQGDDEQQQPERKRPAFASVIVDALKMDSLQRLCSSLEPILRRVVSEEVERALAKLGPARLSGRSSPKRIEGPDGRNLQLHFKSRLSLPLFTGGKVEGEQGAAIHVVLVDANTGHVVTTGPESSVKLDIVVLEGDFNNEDGEGWTQEEFESHEVKEREGKRPLLNGDLQVTIKEGVGTVGELTFTDNSSWIRSRKFRLGLKVTSGFCQGVRIREAKTEPFTVKDHRGELYKKHYPPVLNDEVWRLEKIGKDGSFHKRLTNAGIFTVEDFLRLMVKDSQRLRNILGGGMSNKMWEALMEHAKTCVLTEKLYVYEPDDARNSGVVFNNIYQLIGLITGKQYYTTDSLSDSQKVYVDILVKKAYDNWNQVVEYDSKSLLSFKLTTRSSASGSEPLIGQIDYSNPLEPQIPISRTISLSDKSSMDSGLPVGGYNNNSGSAYTSSQPINSHSSDKFYTTNSNEHEQLNPQHTRTTSSDSSVGLALGPPQSSALEFEAMSSSVHQSNINLFDNDWTHIHDDGVDALLSEEDIRIRSHEMLENEDMQQLLRLFSMSGHGSINVPDDEFSFSSYMASPSPTFSCDEDRNRPGKAVVGWLKIKAAMRWGFFIRKKAAEKRAQLVELDD